MATFTNQAQMNFRGSVLRSNTVSGTYNEVVTMGKNAIDATYTPGETITYAINLVNSGTTQLTGLSISDTLGSYTFSGTTVYPLDYVASSAVLYINGVLQSAPTVTAGPPLVISGINLPAGGNALLLYNATANSYAPLGSSATITNTATLTGGGISSAITATETISQANEPALNIVKSVEPSAVTENSTITYTFTIENYGSKAVVETDNLSILDMFDPLLSNISVTFNGSAWTADTEYTYDTSTGEFVTNNTYITVPAATYTVDSTTGEYTANPGISTLIVTGTV